MADDKRFASGRFGVNKDVPTDKQQQDEWTRRQFVLGAQGRMLHYLERGKDELAFKWATLLAKVQRFEEQQQIQHNNNLMFVTKFENQQAWEEAAKRHAKRIEELDVSADLATDTE